MTRSICFLLFWFDFFCFVLFCFCLILLNTKCVPFVSYVFGWCTRDLCCNVIIFVVKKYWNKTITHLKNRTDESLVPLSFSQNLILQNRLRFMLSCFDWKAFDCSDIGAAVSIKRQMSRTYVIFVVPIQNTIDWRLCVYTDSVVITTPNFHLFIQHRQMYQRKNPLSYLFQ